MKRILVFSLFLITVFSGWTQDRIPPNDPAYLDRYAGYNFNSRFFALINSDDLSAYYLVDFSKLPSRFERVYFMNLSFSADEIVNVRVDADRNIVCFKALFKYKETEIKKVFDDLKQKTNDVNTSWTSDKKTEWLKENDKYKFTKAL
ncbi:MAG: hypothetical protein WCP32_12810 [Bacteroidota bacterium]